MARSRRKPAAPAQPALPPPRPLPLVHRRQFLKGGLIAAGGVFLYACTPAATEAPTTAPQPTSAPATSAPANTQAPAPTAVPPPTDVPMGDIVPELIVSQLAFPSYEEWWRQIPPELAKVGIRTKVEPIEANSWIEKAIGQHDYGHFTSTSVGITDDRLDPNWFLTNVLHSNAADPGGNNLSYWRNEEADALIDAQAVELDQAARIDLVKQVQTLFAAESPMVPVYYINDVQAINKEKFSGALQRESAGILRFNNLTSFLNIEPLTDQRLLRLDNNHDGTSTNPFLSAGSLFNNATMLWVYDTLARRDENLATIPWAAESWEWVDDTNLDVVLRQGMTFHDGQPVTADDLVFTIDYARQHSIPSWNNILSFVSAAAKQDDNTVRLTLPAPFAPFVGNVLTSLYIVPQHIWEGVADPNTFENTAPVGSGPFRFGQWRPNESWTFLANDDHFRAPKIDVLVAVIPTPETLIGLLETQELDGTGTYLRGDAQIDSVAALPHMEVVTTGTIGVQSVYMDTSRLPASDPAFRRAVHHLVPKARLLDAVAGKGGGLVAEANWITPSSEWYQPGLPNYEFDPEAARAVLAEAGYSWDEDGNLHYPPGVA
jgi:peptide/nickel transport system substrate-binding protein